jgi:hypothetical protein
VTLTPGTTEAVLEKLGFSGRPAPDREGLDDIYAATRTTDDARFTVAFGHRFDRRPDGVTNARLGDDRDRVLVEEFGYSEAMVARLQADDPPPAINS